MTALKKLQQLLETTLADKLQRVGIAYDELTLIVDKAHLVDVCQCLKEQFHFEQLIDVSGVDYLQFGEAEWKTTRAASTGYSRATRPLRLFSTKPVHDPKQLERFCVTYHLLSIAKNIRLRVKVFLPNEETPRIDSVMHIWPTANWHEREVFDMFGVLFNNHEDLRRILTDYNFEGHPFRKDFPVSGYVEMRYDNKKERIVYEPIEIEPRVLVPKVIREDSRYLDDPDVANSLTDRGEL